MIPAASVGLCWRSCGIYHYRALGRFPSAAHQSAPFFLACLPAATLAGCAQRVLTSFLAYHSRRGPRAHIDA